MSLPKNVVSVDLGNLPRPVALDLLDASAGTSVVTYADPSGHTRLTLPYSVTDDSVAKFYVDADEVWLSAKVNGHEVADAGGTTKYVVTDTHRSDAAPAVQLEWNADRLNQAAPSGGSTSLPVCSLDTSGGTTGNAIGFTDLTTFTWVNIGPSSTAFSVDLAAAKVTINEDGLYLARLGLRNATITTAGYLTFDSSASSSLGAKKYLGVGSPGDTDVLTLASCVAGETMVPEEFGDGTLAGTFGSPFLTIVQLAKF